MTTLLAALALAVALASTPAAAAWCVPDAGDRGGCRPAATIQAAIDRARPGDLIHVNAGNPAEPAIVAHTRVRILCHPGAVLRGAPGGGGVLLHATADKVRIEGCRILGDGYLFAVILDGDDSTVLRSTISGARSVGWGGDAVGVHARGNHAVVLDSHFADLDIGVHFHGSTRGVLSGSTFADNDTAIKLSNGHATVTGNAIESGEIGLWVLGLVLGGDPAPGRSMLRNNTASGQRFVSVLWGPNVRNSTLSGITISGSLFAFGALHADDLANPTLGDLGYLFADGCGEKFSGVLVDGQGHRDDATAPCDD